MRTRWSSSASSSFVLAAVIGALVLLLLAATQASAQTASCSTQWSNIRTLVSGLTKGNVGSQRTKILNAMDAFKAAGCIAPDVAPPPPPPPPPPAPLTVSCPANVTTTAAIGATSAAVTFPAPTTSGGTAPISTSCAPASGSSFPIGTSPVSCTARDSASQTASCGFSVTVNAQAAPAGSWIASYWNASYPGELPTSAPVITRADAAINFNWGGGSPDPRINADLFSARWTKADTFNAATYQFTATADDGIRLYVDNTVILDSWIDQSATTYVVAWPMTAGQHTITVEYYENGGDAVAQVSYLAAPVVTPPTPGAAALTVAWDADPTGETSGYLVYVGTASGQYGTPIDVGPATSWLVGNLTAGVRYYFAVKAYSDVLASTRQFSDFSNEVSGVPQ